MNLRKRGHARGNENQKRETKKDKAAKRSKKKKRRAWQSASEMVGKGESARAPLFRKWSSNRGA